MRMVDRIKVTEVDCNAVLKAVEELKQCTEPQIARQLSHTGYKDYTTDKVEATVNALLREGLVKVVVPDIKGKKLVVSAVNMKSKFDNMQEIKCADDGKTLCYKDGDNLVIQCKRCKSNEKDEYRRVPIKQILESTEKEIKI
jgi:hypothetical protein